MDAMRQTGNSSPWASACVRKKKSEENVGIGSIRSDGSTNMTKNRQRHGTIQQQHHEIEGRLRHIPLRPVIVDRLVISDPEIFGMTS